MVDLSIVMLNYQRVLTIPHRNSPFGVEKNDRWRLEFGLSVVGSMTPVASSLVAPSWWCVVKISTPWLENASQYHTIYWYIYIYIIYIYYIYIEYIECIEYIEQFLSNPTIYQSTSARFQQSSPSFSSPLADGHKIHENSSSSAGLAARLRLFAPADPANPANPRWITIPTAQHRVWLTALTATMRMAMAALWTTCRTWAMGDTPKGIPDTRTMDSMDMDRPLDSRGRRLMNRSWVMWKTCNLEMNTVMWCVTWIRSWEDWEGGCFCTV